MLPSVDDVGTLFVTHGLSLVVGLVGGYGLQQLATRQAKRERRVLEDVATVERCIQIFNARVDYIVAYHTKPTAVRNERQTEYQALYYGSIHALPETIVEPTTWQVWMRAERDARDGSRPIGERMQQVKEARLTVLAWLNERRTELASKLSG